MPIRMATALTAALLAAGALAAAQTPEPLTAREARAALLGVELSGSLEGAPDISWRECIERDGETRYWFAGEGPRQGRLRIADDGLACFAYVDTGFQDEQCWFVLPDPQGLRFEHADSPQPAFIATAMRRVGSCDGGSVGV